jgi:hypothetical protein
MLKIMTASSGVMITNIIKVDDMVIQVNLVSTYYKGKVECSVGDSFTMWLQSMNGLTSLNDMEFLRERFW